VTAANGLAYYGKAATMTKRGLKRLSQVPKKIETNFLSNSFNLLSRNGERLNTNFDNMGWFEINERCFAGLF